MDGIEDSYSDDSSLRQILIIALIVLAVIIVLGSGLGGLISLLIWILVIVLLVYLIMMLLGSFGCPDQIIILKGGGIINIGHCGAVPCRHGRVGFRGGISIGF